MTTALNVAAASVAQRLAALDWIAIERRLGADGFAETPPVLSAGECAGLVTLYDDDRPFRSRVDMARHRFGEGDYKYLAYPLPDIVADLRLHAYPHLAGIANRWNAALDIRERYPASLKAFLTRCAASGQHRPTPLLLHYEAGGYNCLHQDLYGEVAFPFQLVCFLSEPDVDHEGGEFVLVEQRPRAQSAAHVVRGVRGALLVFTTRYRPVRGSRGHYRVNVRHGVSRVHRGTRYTLGVIFHDAK